MDVHGRPWTSVRAMDVPGCPCTCPSISVDMGVYFLFFDQIHTHGNFERPFTPQTELAQSRNFAKTRFRRFPTFHFSTSEFFFRNFSISKFRFPSIGRGFWGATAKRTSKSDSSSNFALDRLFLRSVRPKIVKNMSVFGSEKVSVGRLDVNFLRGYKK